jgi:hypothetical protein
MDVFALGVVLFELCCGRKPWATADEWRAAVRTGAVPEPDREDLPERMRATIRAALGPVEVRPADAGALLRIWGSGAELGAPFRSEVLAETRSDQHLAPERLFAAALSAAEVAHVEGCARCRLERRRAEAFAENVGSSEVHAPAVPAESTWTATRLVRRRPVQAWASGAAALLLLGFAGWWWMARAPVVPPPAPVAAPRIEVAERSAVAAAPDPVAPIRTPPTEPAPPPPKPRATPRPPPPPPPGRLVVNTIGGPAARFRVDGGELLAAGPLRARTLPPGPHLLQLYAASGEELWSGTIEVRSEEELVWCWDLGAGRPCRQ